jgi:hypothetical protein
MCAVQLYLGQQYLFLQKCSLGIVTLHNGAGGCGDHAARVTIDSSSASF